MGEGQKARAEVGREAGTEGAVGVKEDEVVGEEVVELRDEV